jgi:hypothetical protein
VPTFSHPVPGCCCTAPCALSLTNTHEALQGVHSRREKGQGGGWGACSDIWVGYHPCAAPVLLPAFGMKLWPTLLPMVVWYSSAMGLLALGGHSCKVCCCHWRPSAGGWRPPQQCILSG